MHLLLAYPFTGLLLGQCLHLSSIALGNALVASAHTVSCVMSLAVPGFGVVARRTFSAMLSASYYSCPAFLP